ncbi:MAG: hypothetical protein ACRDTE_33125, partial [Pseudonocardiaceae bacterium]
MDFVSEPGRQRRVPQRPRPQVTEAPASREQSAPPARSRLSPSTAVALQRQAGNRAVSRLVAQRRAASGTGKSAGSTVS